MEALWQGCTSLREHRGDGHVAALVAAGLDACEALVTLAASQGVDRGVFVASRGWSSAEWDGARARLERRGLVEGDRLTGPGAVARDALESTTDRLAAAAVAGLDGDAARTLATGLDRVASAVSDRGVIPYPNPIGLPSPSAGVET